MSFKKTYVSKETIHEVKGQHTEWKKVIANHISEKLLSKKIYMELLQLNSDHKNNPMKNRVKDLNRHVSKDDIKMANQHIRYSVSLIIRDIQVKTTR